MELPISFRQMEVFHAVARRLSFSRAAEELYTSQPYVSKQVKELERSLGVDLFHRVGRRVALTDAGRVLFDYAQRAFELRRDTARALAELQGLERGYLRLVASSTPGVHLLPGLMAAFRQLHPGVGLCLQVSNSGQVVQQVLRGVADLGFVGSPLAPESVHWQPFAEDLVVLVVAPGHPFAARHSMEPSELMGETVLLREEGSGTRLTVEHELERLGVRPYETIEVGSPEALKEAVAAGLGVGFLSRLAVGRELTSDHLRAVTVAGMNLGRQLGMVSARARRLSTAALAFAAHVQRLQQATGRPTA